MVLIPSSSGQGFKVLGYALITQETYGLNPFFIRARFQSAAAGEIWYDRNVLIPSSSGQGFKVAGKQACPYSDAGS